jgi:hypothetical protein
MERPLDRAERIFDISVHFAPCIVMYFYWPCDEKLLFQKMPTNKKQGEPLGAIARHVSGNISHLQSNLLEVYRHYVYIY